MKVSTITATLLGLGLTSYTYAQQQPGQHNQPDIEDAEQLQAALDGPQNPALPEAANAFQLTHDTSSSSSNSPDSETRLINIKLLLDPSNGGDLANQPPRPLGFNVALNPVTSATRKYSAYLSTADAADADADADVLRLGASDLRERDFYLTAGVVRGQEAGVICKVVSPDGQLTVTLPFEAETVGMPVPASGVVCAETKKLLEEAREAEEMGVLVA